MLADDLNSKHEIGYKNPPKRTQFPPGISGNPHGRPKGRRNVATVLRRTLAEKVIINENGIRKTVTKLEAAIKQLANKAVSGDLHAMRQLLPVLSVLDDSSADLPPARLDTDDQKVMERVLARLAESFNGVKNDEHE
jgi:Family of unknown function (DUF5681)